MTTIYEFIYFRDNDVSNGTDDVRIYNSNCNNKKEAIEDFIKYININCKWWIDSFLHSLLELIEFKNNTSIINTILNYFDSEIYFIDDDIDKIILLLLKYNSDKDSVINIGREGFSPEFKLSTLSKTN